MPLYEYACDNPKCDEKIERLLTHEEHEQMPAPMCEDCCAGRLRPQVSVIGSTPSKWGDTKRTGQI
jgi:predicted nucleic acid-binding Zn ribbon protein